ncbi:MAG: hypothetical protein ACYCST_20505 [Acidimicrobiales bacterium]
MRFYGEVAGKAIRRAAPPLFVAIALAPTAAVVAPAAAAGRSGEITDTASLHLLSADGNTLIESGRASGDLPGTVRVSLTLRSADATSKFTIQTSGGSLSGVAHGKLKTGRAGWDSFGGALSVQSGTGRFRGARGNGGLYGSIYRVTDAVKVKVSGKLRYRG